MTSILPKIYEEILERNFDEEVSILKNDKLISILLQINDNEKIRATTIVEDKNSYEKLLNSAFIRKAGDFLYLSQKGVNFLRMFGIQSKTVDKLLEDNSTKLPPPYNYKDLHKVSKINLFRKLIISENNSSIFLKFNKNKSILECTLTINCIFNLNDFLKHLKSLVNNDVKLIIYYQTPKQRKDYLLKSSHLLFRFFFPLIDYANNKLKKYYVKHKKLKYLLFYNSRISKAEILGRIIHSGFKILVEIPGNEYNKLIFLPNQNPIENKTKETYNSPLIKFKRLGKNEKIIYLNKFRTMYPYSEYLNEYYYQNMVENKPDKILSGDFRVPKLGRFLRKYWLDELPMIINLIKGDLKLFGVRPLSLQYLELYPKDLRRLRKHCKPGLFTLTHSDLSYSLEESINSERKYLVSYFKKPIRTDLKYLYKIFLNIFFPKKE